MKQLHKHFFKIIALSAGVFILSGAGAAEAHGNNGGRGGQLCAPFSQKALIGWHRKTIVRGTACKGRGGEWFVTNSSIPHWKYRATGPMVVEQKVYHHPAPHQQRGKKYKYKHYKNHHKHNPAHKPHYDGRSKVIYKSDVGRRYNQNHIPPQAHWRDESSSVTIRYNW
jgi:hypothetical protein